MYHIDQFNTVIHPSSHNSRQRPHYGLAPNAKLPLMQKSQPVTLSSLNGTVECSVIRISAYLSVILSIACVYRRPSSELKHFKYAMSRITAELDRFRSMTDNVEHHTFIIGDFNMDWCQQSTRDTMKELLPACTQLVCDVTTDNSSTLDHVYTVHNNVIRCCPVLCGRVIFQ